MLVTPSDAPLPFTRLAIVGFGLIGASLAAALRARADPIEIVAVVRSEDSRQLAERLGTVDRAVIGPEAGLIGADVVMLCVPMLAMRDALLSVERAWTSGAMPAHAIVSDAGSVKGSFVADAQAVFGDTNPLLRRIVPGHPIAGRESSGMAAADAELYRGRRVLLTPSPLTDVDAVNGITALWERTGASVEALSPEHHDRVLAATSHLPHMLAYALVDALAKQQEVEEIFRYAAGGFRDFSRIASSDPVMWRDVCVSNRAALLEAMDAFRHSLDGLYGAIEQGDSAAVQAVFQRAKAARDTFTG